MVENIEKKPTPESVQDEIDEDMGDDEDATDEELTDLRTMSVRDELKKVKEGV